jgi:nucleoside phosphorylase
VIDAIFVPRGAEARAVRGAAARAGSTVRVVELGFGPVAARAVAEKALREAGSLRAALITGVCGLLSPAFAAGETLVYGELLAEGAAPIVLDRTLIEALGTLLAGAQTGIRAVASERIVTSAEAKRDLFARTSAEAVDMETYAVAERLAAAGLAVAALRTASDAAGDGLPDIASALGPDGLDGRALAVAILRDPRAGLRLIDGGVRALGALRRSMEAVLRGSAL